MATTMTGVVFADVTTKISFEADNMAVISDMNPTINIAEVSASVVNKGRVNLASYDCAKSCTLRHPHDMTALMSFTIPEDIAKYAETVTFNIYLAFANKNPPYTFTVNQISNTGWNDKSVYQNVALKKTGKSVSMKGSATGNWYSFDISDLMEEDGTVNLAFNAYVSSSSLDAVLGFLLQDYNGSWGDINYAPNVTIEVPESVAAEYKLKGKTFFQKNTKGVKQLEPNPETGVYVADDGVAFVGLEGVYPSDKYSMVQRYVVKESGRYRVTGRVKPVDAKGSGTVIKIYKNDQIMKQGYFPPLSDGAIDIRFLAEIDDVIDVEACIDDYVGHNYTEWSIDVSRVPSSIANNTSTTVLGTSPNIISETKLSDYLGSNKPDDVKIYTTLYGIKHEMEYNSTNKRWQLNEKYIRRENIIASDERVSLEEMVYQNDVEDNNYVSETQVRTSSNPTSNATTYIEIPITKAGTILVDGKMALNSSADGELVKVYLNDKVLWSNRLGGDVSTKYDEPYESKFFVDDVHAVANVKAGDILKFGFNRWRFAYSSEYVDISDIKIKYIEGEMLSENTRWSLEHSIVIDTVDKCIYIDGKRQSVDVYVDNGTTYISAFSAKSLFGENITTDGKAYIPLRKVVESIGKNVVWAANRLVIVHDGFDDVFTFNELSEIETKMEIKGGDLFD